MSGAVGRDRAARDAVSGAGDGGFRVRQAAAGRLIPGQHVWQVLFPFPLFILPPSKKIQGAL